MTSFKIESWLWYGLVVLMVCLRFLSRYLHFKSIARFQIEDCLMLFLFCMYTTFLVLINISVQYQTNLIDPHDIPHLTPEDIADRTYGSKVNLAVEQTMCTVQWGAKVCLLILYFRLTENLVQNLMVKMVTCYVGFTFIVMEVLYFGVWCRPFTDFWQTPTDNVQCTTALHHLIVNLTFNLTSDVLIMSIPLPLLLRAQLAIKRKLILVFPFTLGFFTMVCAILSKHLSFTQPFSPDWVFWYTREASCVMIVANMPYTWGLARRLFHVNAFWSKGDHSSRTNSAERTDTQNTATEYVGGEVQEVHEVETRLHLEGSRRADTGQQSGGFWSRILSSPGSFGNKTTPPRQTTESATESIEEVKMPISAHSNTLSANSEKWSNLDWAKKSVGVQVVQVSDSSNPGSPNLLTPPAVLTPASSIRRVSSTDGRRCRTLEVSRVSSHGSRRTSRHSMTDARRNLRPPINNVDAIDRLYRLDDEDLVADLEMSRSRSYNSSCG